MIDRDFEQVSEEHMKSMPTKPEGPAQEMQMNEPTRLAPHCSFACETGKHGTCSGVSLMGHVCECGCHMSATPAPSQPAPDGTCEECGQPNPIWFAPNDIWNKLIPGRVGFICPRCFALKSPGTAWVLQEAEPRVYSTSDAPSQPAGAREWRLQWGWNGAERTVFLTHDGRDGIRLDADSASYIRALMELAQQTAAKDAELSRLRGDLYEVRGVVTSENFAQMQQRAEAAERERDSLRAELDHAVDCFNRNCKRCNQNAALKAGKETQQP